MTFAGQNILVLGGSGALGSRIATALLNDGANVVATSRTQESLARIPAGALPTVVDVADSRSINDFISWMSSNYTTLDGVVIASGQVGFAPLEATSAEHMSQLMQVNYVGPAAIVNGLFPLLKAHTSEKAFVVGFTGVVVEQIFPGMAAYTSSKVALSAYLQTIEKEWRRYKIRSLDVHLGHTETGLANRARFGTAPTMQTGHDPEHAVDVVIQALTSDARVITSSEF